MIVTDNIIKYIPFEHLTRTQVAELLGKKPGSVDYYVTQGKKITGDNIVHLKKEPNGQYLTANVIDFINKTNKSK
jgi:plasmid maintenance system antidote protein VapI